MTSRRRNSNKNLGNSISDVRRRLKYLERKPVRTKLQNRVIKAAAIAPSSITADEVDFGTALVTTENPADVVDNPKDGLLVIDPDTNGAFIYSEEEGDYVEIKDATAQASADGKNTIYRQDSQPSGGTYVTGDVWFDTDDDNKIYRYNSATTTWVGFTLGNNALASISANKITAGTIDASVITVSNLDAGNITTGTLTGRTIRTAASGRRVEVDASNNALSFYNAAGTALGHIRPADDYSGVIISSGGSATTSFATSAWPKMLMYPSGNDGQFTLVVDNLNGGLSISSSGGVYEGRIGPTNTSTLVIGFSLREVGFAQASVFPDLASMSGVSAVEGRIVLTYT
jgi:hypothetical protein